MMSGMNNGTDELERFTQRDNEAGEKNENVDRSASEVGTLQGD